MIYMSSNNVLHRVTKNFTTLRYTSPNYTSLHFTTIFPLQYNFEIPRTPDICALMNSL
jgi:hypothetical protein